MKHSLNGRIANSDVLKLFISGKTTRDHFIERLLLFSFAFFKEVSVLPTKFVQSM